MTKVVSNLVRLVTVTELMDLTQIYTFLYLDPPEKDVVEVIYNKMVGIFGFYASFCCFMGIHFPILNPKS